MPEGPFGEAIQSDRITEENIKIKEAVKDKQFIIQKPQPVVVVNDLILDMPNYSGIKKEALKTDATVLGSGNPNFWISGSNFLWDIGGTKGVSGSAIYAGDGGVSGSFFTGKLSGSTNYDSEIRANITGIGSQVLRRNSGNTALEFATLAAGGGTNVSGSGTFDPMANSNEAVTSTSFVELVKLSGSIVLNETMKLFGYASCVVQLGVNDQYCRIHIDGTSGSAYYTDVDGYTNVALIGHKNSVSSGTRWITVQAKVGSGTCTYVGAGGGGLVTSAVGLIGIA